MDLVTLQSIKYKVRLAADMLNSNFVTDTDLLYFIQDSYKDFYNEVVESGSDYYTIPVALTVTVGNSVALPNNFWKMRGLDDISGGASAPLTVQRYNFAERNDYEDLGYNYLGQNRYSDVRHNIIGNLLYILPADRAKRPFTLWYVPTPTLPVLDADTIDVLQGYDKYIIYDCAIKCLAKEESDTSVYSKLFAQVKESLTRMKPTRDESTNEKVARVRNQKRNESRRDF